MAQFVKPLRHSSPADLIRRSEEMSVRLSKAMRKYSLGLLEEAFQLSERLGVTEAAKVSGVNKNSLSHYRQIRMREMGIKSKGTGNKKNSIDPVRKRACFEMHQNLLKSRFSSSRKCWIEAGRLTGVNGRSVEFQVVRGLYTP